MSKYNIAFKGCVLDALLMIPFYMTSLWYHCIFKAIQKLYFYVCSVWFLEGECCFVVNNKYLYSYVLVMPQYKLFCITISWHCKNISRYTTILWTMIVVHNRDRPLLHIIIITIHIIHIIFLFCTAIAN